MSYIRKYIQAHRRLAMATLLLVTAMATIIGFYLNPLTITHTPTPQPLAVHPYCSGNVNVIYLPVGGHFTIDGDIYSRANNELHDYGEASVLDRSGYKYRVWPDGRPVGLVFQKILWSNQDYYKWLVTWCGENSFVLWQNPERPNLYPPPTPTPVATFTTQP